MPVQHQVAALSSTAFLIISAIKVVVVFGGVMVVVAYSTLLERWISAWIQDRLGPNRVGPGGLLFLETFLEAQKAFGWGPTNDAHLLKSGELLKLVAPLVVLHGREVVEAVDNARWSAMSSVLAQRK